MKSSDDNTKTWTQEEIEEYAADFTEVTRQYNIEHSVPIASSTGGGSGSGAQLNNMGNVSTHQEILQWPRPKSSGFVVMSRILDSYGAVKLSDYYSPRK